MKHFFKAMSNAIDVYFTTKVYGDYEIVIVKPGTIDEHFPDAKPSPMSTPAGKQLSSLNDDWAQYKRKEAKK